MAAELLEDLFVRPHRDLVRWSRVTHQTSQVRLAYPGQHLASIITGVPGTGTAARGKDLIDGTEVKSCSRANQLGSCVDCKARVLPHLKACAGCASTRINRKTDSHWILSMRSDQEFRQYVEAPRLLLILFDRPSSDPSSVRIRGWEVWPGAVRHAHFVWFVTNYYQDNYLLKVEKGLTPSPLNLHPLKFDFYMMNPVRVFRARVESADTEDAAVVVNEMVDPLVDRAGLDPVPMPASLLTPAERLAVVAASTLSDLTLSTCTESAVSVPDVARLRSSPEGREAIARNLTVVTEAARVALSAREKSIKLTASTYTRR